MASYDDIPGLPRHPPDALDYANAARDALKGIDPAGLADTDRFLYAVAAGILSLASNADRLDDRVAEVNTTPESKL